MRTPKSMARRWVKRTLFTAVFVTVLGFLVTGHLRIPEITPPSIDLPAIELPDLPEAAPVIEAHPAAPAAEYSELMTQLAALPTGPVPAADYDRDEFGQRWADVDRTGCDQRNEALAAAMTDVVFRVGTHDCVVESGIFYDVYDGSSWPFTKSEDGGGIQVDHVVPLSHAWAMGAAAWSAEQRVTFANELANLQPTANAYNQGKSDSGPTEWLPPNGDYQCEYLERWAQIKVTWSLAVADDERALLLDRLAGCPASGATS